MLHLQLSTIVFQLLNFLILLAVLSWFFYRPVLRVMRNREERITARLRDVDEQARAAEAGREQLAERSRQAEAEAAAMLDSARKEAGEERDRILAAGRDEAARLLAEAQGTIQEQERLALGRLEARVRESALTLAGSLIREAAGPVLHEQLLARFLQEGIRPANSARDSLDVAVRRDHTAVDVELAYPSSEATEAAIRGLISKELGGEVGGSAVTLRVNPALLAGVRVLLGEFVLDLSLRRTLEQLQTGDGARKEAQ